MANFLPNNKLSLRKSVLRKAVLVWLIPLFVTSLLFSLSNSAAEIGSVLIALISLAPPMSVYLLTTIWMSLSTWIRFALAFGFGVSRFLIAAALSDQAFRPVDLGVAGLFSLFWWVLVERLLVEQNLIERKFLAITQMGRQELATRIYSNLEFNSDRLFSALPAEGDQPLALDQETLLADRLAVISIEREIALAAEQVGGFQEISSTDLPKLRFLEVLKKSLRTPKFDLQFALFGYGLLIAAGAFSNYSADRAILTTIATTAAFGLVLFSWNTFEKRHRTSSWLTPVPFFVLATLPVILPEWLLTSLGYSPELSNWEVSIGTPLTLVSIAIGSAVLTNLRAARRKLIEDLATRLAAADVLAIYLHNSLKSELGALSAQLAAADTSNERRRVWEEIEQLLSADFLDAAKKSEQYPRKRLIEVLDAWSPIIKIDATALLESPASESSLVCRLTEEAVANAARHANASEIRIQVKSEANFWTLILQSNGKNTTLDGKTGFGLRLLELVAESWSIKGTSSSQKLTIKLLR